jgi:hypothetical protein
VAEILRAPRFGQAVRLPGPTDVDPGTADVIAAAWQEGHTAGWREGHRDGRGEAADFAAGVRAAVDQGVAGYAAACAEARTQLADHLVELAEALVEGVLGHLPDTATQGMLGRLHHALELIEDGPLTAVVHPSTLELMQPALDLKPGGQPMQLRPDPRLAPGELVIEGPWAFAELTWPRLVEAARTALTEIRDADQDRAFEHDERAELPGGAA